MGCTCPELWNKIENMSLSEIYLIMIWWRHQVETFFALLALLPGIHRSPVNSSQKGKWRGALVFSFICAWSSGCANNWHTGDLRRHGAHYDAIVMFRLQPQVKFYRSFLSKLSQQKWYFTPHYHNVTCHLMATDGATKRVSHHLDKSLQIIWRWHLLTRSSNELLLHGQMMWCQFVNVSTGRVSY